MSKRLFASLFIACVFATPVFAAEHDKPDAKPSADAKAAPAPQEKSVATQHSVTINGHSIAYTATAGTLIIRNEKGEPDASVFYVAYTAGGGKGSAFGFPAGRQNASICPTAFSHPASTEQGCRPTV